MDPGSYSTRVAWQIHIPRALCSLLMQKLMRPEVHYNEAKPTPPHLSLMFEVPCSSEGLNQKVPCSKYRKCWKFSAGQAPYTERETVWLFLVNEVSFGKGSKNQWKEGRKTEVCNKVQGQNN